MYALVTRRTCAVGLGCARMHAIIENGARFAVLIYAHSFFSRANWSPVGTCFRPVVGTTFTTGDVMFKEIDLQKETDQPRNIHLFQYNDPHVSLSLIFGCVCVLRWVLCEWRVLLDYRSAVDSAAPLPLSKRGTYLCHGCCTNLSRNHEHAGWSTNPNFRFDTYDSSWCWTRLPMTSPPPHQRTRTETRRSASSWQDSQTVLLVPVGTPS